MQTQNRSKSDKRQTMSRMLAAAHQEFCNKGLAGGRIDEIARNAGVTKQLIFHYSGSKEGLFVAVLDETSARLMTGWVDFDVEQMTPPKALRALLIHIFDQYHNDPLPARLAKEGVRYPDKTKTQRHRYLALAHAVVNRVRS